MEDKKSFAETRGVQRDFRDATLSKVNPVIAEKIQEWLEIKSILKPLLILRGFSGAGKTYVMAAILNDKWFKYAANGKTVRFFKEPDFHAEIIKGIDQPGHDMGQARKRLCLDTDYLMIDDFGTSKMTEARVENIYTLFDERYNDRTNLVTVISTNLSLDDIEKRFSEYDLQMAWRIRDRLKKATDILFPDLRYRDRDLE